MVFLRLFSILKVFHNLKKVKITVYTISCVLRCNIYLYCFCLYAWGHYINFTVVWLLIRVNFFVFSSGFQQNKKLCSIWKEKKKRWTLSGRVWYVNIHKLKSIIFFFYIFFLLQTLVRVNSDFNWNASKKNVQLSTAVWLLTLK